MATVCATEVQELRDEEIVRFENLVCMEKKYPIDPLYMVTYAVPGIEERDVIINRMISTMINVQQRSLAIYLSIRNNSEEMAAIQHQIVFITPSMIMHAVALFNRVFSVDKNLEHHIDTFVNIAYGCMIMAIKMGCGVDSTKIQSMQDMVLQHSLVPTIAPEKIEYIIINVLTFDLMPATPYDFLMELFFSRPYNGEFTKEIRDLAVHILYLTSIDEFLVYPPHVLAEASLLLADNRPNRVYHEEQTLDCMNHIKEVLVENADYRPILFMAARINAEFLRLGRNLKDPIDDLVLEPRANNEVPCIRQEELAEGTVEDLGVIAEGTYGKVHKIKFTTRHGESIAVCKISKIRESIDFTVLREVSLLKMMRHPNIVKLLDIWIKDDNTFGFILEFVKEDMYHFIRNLQGKRYLTMTNLRLVMRNLLEGIAYLHDNDIIHRDIKPQNILIDYEAEINGPLTLKITDFGLARKITNVNMTTLTHNVITLWYRPPEILFKTNRYSPAIDIWSVGCVLVELVNLTPIFAGDNENSVINKIFRVLGTRSVNIDTFKYTQGWGEYSQSVSFLIQGHPMDEIVPIRHIQKTERETDVEFDESYRHLKDLTCQMLALDPRKRITAIGALNHPFFAVMELE